MYSVQEDSHFISISLDKFKKLSGWS